MITEIAGSRESTIVQRPVADNLREQQRKMLLQSVFCGLIATFIVSLTRNQPLTPASKAGFVLLTGCVTGVSYFLLTLAAKIQRIHEKMLPLEKRVEELEGIEKARKEKPKSAEEKQFAFFQVIKICETDFKSQTTEQRAELYAKISTLIQENQLDINTIFEWKEFKKVNLLRIALSMRNDELAMKLIEMGMSGDYRDETGKTYLHFFAEHCGIHPDSLVLLKAILEKFPELINVQDKGLRTPLHALVCATKGKTIFFEHFLKAGADVNILDKGKQSPVEDLSVFVDSTDLIEPLLSPSLNLEKLYQDGTQFLVRLYKEGKSSIPASFWDKFLEVGGWTEINKTMFVRYACRYAKEDLLEILLKKWAVEDSTQNHFLNETPKNYKDCWFLENHADIPLIMLYDERCQCTWDQRYRMSLSLLKYMDHSKLKANSKFGAIIYEMIDMGFHEILKSLKFPLLFLQSDRRLLENKLLRKIDKAKNKKDYIETFKIIYQPEDQIDPDLEVIYDTYIK